MSADELLAEPFVNAVASWEAVRGPLPEGYRAEFHRQPSTAFDSLALRPHAPTRSRVGRPCIDRSHLVTLTSVRTVERALLQHYAADELIARRPSGVRDVADLLEPHGYFVDSLDRHALLRAFDSMCIEHLGPNADAQQVPNAKALTVLLEKRESIDASFVSLEDVQRHLLTLTPPRWATRLVLETLTHPGRLLEGLPLFTPRAGMLQVEATRQRARAHARPHD